MHYVCIFGHHVSQSMDQPGKVAKPACDQLNRERMDISLFPVRAFEFGFSRHVRLSRPASSCLFSTSRSSLVLTHGGISNAFRKTEHLFILPTVMESVSSLSSPEISYRWRSLVLMGAVRLTESRALSQDTDGKGRSNRSPSVWIQYVDPPPETLRQTSYRTPPGLASHHRGAAQETRHRMTSYNRALEIIRCESIETRLRTRRLLWAGTLLRMSGGRLPKRIMFENLEDAVRRGRGGKEKEWTHCVQSDFRAFGITVD